MAYLVFLCGRHLAEGCVAAQRPEHGVVAEALGPPGRPYQRALDLAPEGLDVAVRPRQGQRADEARAAILLAFQRVLDPLHGNREVLPGSGPAGRMDAGPAAERRDREPRIVGERRQPRLG